MVVVRLSRAGAKKRPFYNIVVTDKRNRRDGSFIERVGFYNPVAPESEKQAIRIDVARIEHWRSHGAQILPSVERLIRSGLGTVTTAASQESGGATEAGATAATDASGGGVATDSDAAPVNPPSADTVAAAQQSEPAASA